MSQAHIEQFYKKVVSDQALFHKLADGAETPEQFIERAVAAAKADGLQVDVPEATKWIEGQMRASASGELSDAQLEGVAGGKRAPNSTARDLQNKANEYGRAAENPNASAGDQFVNAMRAGGYQLGAWFTSW